MPLTPFQRIAFCLAAPLLCALPAGAQVNISGQASAALLKTGAGPSQYVYNNGRETFTWRLDLFADALLSEHISLAGNFRMLQDEQPNIDLLALRIAEVASTPLSLEVGKIDIPFGNLGARRYPKTNPFLSLPLMREHLTSLRSSAYQLWTADSRYTSSGDGVRLLDQGLYDLGVKAYASAGIFDLYAALTNGTVSATSGYYKGGLNTHHGFGKTFRLAATPAMGLTVGASYAFGPFMNDVTAYGGAYDAYDPLDHQQQTFGADLDFSYGYLSCYGELVHNIWNTGDLFGSDLTATGYSFEAAYILTPRLTVAARAGGLVFNTISTTLYQGGYLPAPYAGTWDRNVFRLEGAVGYRLSREVLVKIVYQWNKTMNNVPQDPHDDLFGIQTAASF
jgi:hypothetical protein